MKIVAMVGMMLVLVMRLAGCEPSPEELARARQVDTSTEATATAAAIDARARATTAAWQAIATATAAAWQAESTRTAWALSVQATQTAVPHDAGRDHAAATTEATREWAVTVLGVTGGLVVLLTCGFMVAAWMQTRAAVEAEAAQQRAYSQARAAAVAIAQTREAVQITRYYQSTIAAMDVESTRTARDAQATVERQRNEATAMQQAVNAEATRQVTFAGATASAVAVQVTRQAMGQAQTAEGFKTGGIILLFVIGTGLAGLAARGLWRVGARATARVAPTEAGEKSSGEPPRDDEVPAPPATTVVYDAEAAQRITDVLAYQDGGTG